MKILLSIGPWFIGSYAGMLHPAHTRKETAPVAEWEGTGQDVCLLSNWCYIMRNLISWHYLLFHSARVVAGISEQAPCSTIPLVLSHVSSIEIAILSKNKSARNLA